MIEFTCYFVVKFCSLLMLDDDAAGRWISFLISSRFIEFWGTDSILEIYRMKNKIGNDSMPNRKMSLLHHEKKVEAILKSTWLWNQFN